jgi:hypothetical protein
VADIELSTGGTGMNKPNIPSMIPLIQSVLEYVRKMFIREESSLDLF